MIPTRVHGLIDYGVAALFAGLSASPAVPAPVGRVLRAAGGYHTAYSLLTDYELGVQPLVTMRQHLALDALGGASLVAAGLLMRRQPDGARAFLVAAGLTELLVTALSSDQPRSGPGQGSGPLGRLAGDVDAAEARTGYPPLDTPKPLAEGVWVVDSVMSGPLGIRLPVRMTVFRLPDGGLLLHSPTRFGLRLREELAQLGPVRHLMAPNVAHWTFLKDWQDAFPEATTWAAPGLRQRGQVRRSGLRLDHDLGEAAPPEWGGGFGTVTVPGGLGFHEVALFHAPTRTLVLTDLVLNLDAAKLPAPLRPVARLMGITAPDGMPPPYLRAVVKKRRAEATQAALRLIGLGSERVIFAHGRPFLRDGTAALRHSFRWLLG